MELRDLILEQKTFQAVKDVPFPRHGCRVVVMKKANPEVADAK